MSDNVDLTPKFIEENISQEIHRDLEDSKLEVFEQVVNASIKSEDSMRGKIVKLQDEIMLQNPIDYVIEVQSFDLIGVENFNVICNPCLVNFVNKLKADVKIFKIWQFLDHKHGNKLRKLKYLKYLIHWTRRL